MIYRPYTNSNAVPGNTLGPVQDNSFPSTSLLGAFVSRLPYAYNLIDSIMQRNPKFQDFKDAEPKRQELIQNQSVYLQEPEFNAAPGTPGSIIVNKDYQSFIYAQVDKDKTRRLTDYRRMAAYAELADCIDEICDECIVKDENDNIVTFNLRGDYTKEIKDNTEKEFKKFISVFDLEDRGWEYFRNFLVDGELFFENIIDEKRKELGIVGVISLPAELLNPVYQNVQNELVKGFLIRKPLAGPTTSTNTKDQEEVFFMNKAQVTYVHSNIWNEFKTIRLPFIENAKRAYRQLSLIEDSVVIYRLVRAPERLKFKVYTGNMPAPKAEAHLRRLMQQYWSKKNFDGQQGDGGKMTNVYDPQSMLDSYWFAKDAQGNGNDVEILPSGGCLAMDTKVPLLDGRTLSLAEMTQEFENGKKNWVYSTNPETGEIVPGLVTWAGVTHKSASVMELEFDNGEKLICTPDHKFPILGKGFVEAKDLLMGESMIPFYTKKEKIKKNTNDYEMVYQPDTKKWEFVHRIIANFFKDTDLSQEMVFCEKYQSGIKNVIHHKDFNRFNNSPENLAWMNAKDHILYHGANRPLDAITGSTAARKRLKYLKENDKEKYSEYIQKLSNASKKRWDSLTIAQKQKHIKNTSDGIKKYFKNLSPEERKYRAEISKENWRKGNFKVNHDPTIKQKRIQTNKQTWAKYKEENNLIYQNLSKYSSQTWKNKWSDENFKKKKIDHQTLVFDEKIFYFVLNLIKNKTTHEFTGEQVVQEINKNQEIKNYFLELNKDKKPKNWDRTGFKETHLILLAQKFGYKDWLHLRKESKYFNHKLVSVKYLDNPIEVGTLTIDGGEKYHNYHTFALSCGVFTKNSLGEIKDLDYFLKKLYNSLKVPTSRFMSADAPFKDGTEITRDELRFARYIIRIQRQFAVSIRDSFITHLKLKGFWKQYKIKQRSIQIRFNVPSSFMAMREQQLLDLKFDNFIKITGNNSISPSYAQKYYLGMTDDLMKENRAWLEKDAAFRWMVGKIESDGPNWRELAVAAAGGATEEGGTLESSPELGGGEPQQPSLGGGEGPEEIPEFGGSAPAAVPETPAPAETTPEVPSAPETPPPTQ
jgi:hypothetical protein